MEVRIVIEARTGVDGVEMEVVNAWMGGQSCLVGFTTIELHDELGIGVQWLVVSADLAVKP